MATRAPRAKYLQSVPRYANSFPGADIGAKINAAFASGLKQVYLADEDVAPTTQIVMPAGTTLYLGNALFDCSTATPGVPTIVMRDGCSVVGIRNQSKVKEAPRAANGRALTIGDYNTFLGGQGTNADGNWDLLVKNLTFVSNGLTGLINVSASTGTVHFGNVHNAEVRECTFIDTHSFGVAFGGAPVFGYHGDRVRVIDCVFQGLWSQNIAVVNANNFVVHHNTLTGTQQVAVTFIDVEANGTNDRLLCGVISDNIVNVLPGANTVDNTFFIQPGAAINIVGADDPPTTNYDYYAGVAAQISVTGNVINGGNYPWNPPSTFPPDPLTRYYAQGYLSQGITVTGGSNIKISDNTLYLVNNQPITLNKSRNCAVVDNKVINCGNTNSGGHSIDLVYSGGCLVKGNDVYDMQGGYYSSIPCIFEYDPTPNGAGPHTDFNQIVDNHLYRYPFNTDEAHGGYVGGGSEIGSDPLIVLCGKNSRKWNNYINGVAVDATLIESVSALRHMAPPGAVAATSTAPSVVMVGGYLTQGDGGFAPWWWDAAATDADNGITVVKPTRISPANAPGRWRRGGGVIKLTTVDRDALFLSATDAGLLIFNVDVGVKKMQCWDGVAWQNLW